LYVVLLAAAWLIPNLDSLSRLAAGYGASISFALSLAGFFLLAGTRHADPGRFIRLLLGGMAARLMIALAAVAIGLGLFDLPAGIFVGSCVVSYVIFMGLEHVYLLPLLKGPGIKTRRNGTE